MTGSLSYALHLSGNVHFKEHPSQGGASAVGLEDLQSDILLAMGGLQPKMESRGLWWREKNSHSLGKDLAPRPRSL